MAIMEFIHYHIHVYQRLGNHFKVHSLLGKAMLYFIIVLLLWNDIAKYFKQNLAIGTHSLVNYVFYMVLSYFKTTSHTSQSHTHSSMSFFQNTFKLCFLANTPCTS